MSRYQFMNLQFVHLSKHRHTENTAEGSSSITLGLAKETISILRNFCNHPEKGSQTTEGALITPQTSLA